ncbi:hypothetical protein MAQ5080_03006 [Marinomonas aquimarina]|uniref:Uncharacterized protein n=1 Tax=Marinomonas aquimarina TaxID=295068 RepID=A0A1A8TLS5_9GAMM|nr:hypothetical protein [Marinomonas aquimarina]SBS34888.1 hypothetical protein MAQ5080_03006 [Marinomonas aquimarina]
MKAAKHLNDMNISLGQARAFLQSNLSTPDLLMQILEQYEVSNEMVAEIMGSSRGHIVRYFAQNGIDSSVLDTFHSDDEIEEDEDEDTGYGSDAVALAVNSNLDAEIGEAMESDLYQIELISGSEYTFTVTSDELTAPRLVLLNDEGERLGSDYQTLEEDEASFTFTASESGTFYLDLSDLVDETTGEYNISFTVMDDFAADLTTTGIVVVDDTASGILEVGGDEDWFAVALVADQSYDIAVDSTDFSTAHIAIYDTTGTFVTELAADDDEDGVLAFTATASETYYVAVSDTDPEVTGNYLVGVQLQEEVIV